jgi:transcriptional regulator with XRE-family HTH domain
MTVAEQFGKNLARLRQRSGLSQEEAALRASLHRTELSQLERGLRVPRIDTAAKLAGAIGVETAELLDGIVWTPAEVRYGCFKEA